MQVPVALTHSEDCWIFAECFVNWSHSQPNLDLRNKHRLRWHPWLQQYQRQCWQSKVIKSNEERTKGRTYRFQFVPPCLSGALKGCIHATWIITENNNFTIGQRLKTGSKLWIDLVLLNYLIQSLIIRPGTSGARSTIATTRGTPWITTLWWWIRWLLTRIATTLRRISTALRRISTALRRISTALRRIATSHSTRVLTVRITSMRLLSRRRISTGARIGTRHSVSTLSVRISSLRIGALSIGITSPSRRTLITSVWCWHVRLITTRRETLNWVSLSNSDRI